uniref:Uncharacterized protein n=1 Tax=Lactarius sp. (in: basidiomycete fungi) TaxID=1886493 RepID=A0A2S0U423_9AGAM|nr:hypothetical protein [Lactarius sp. (in: basidiomycete fungi)]
MNNIINNELVFICLISSIVCLTTGYFIRSYIDSRVIETPNSPLTFNFTREQLQEVQQLLERGEELDQETQVKLDLDFKTILGDDFYQFEAEMQEIHDQFSLELQQILNNDFLNIHCPLESTEFNTWFLETIDIINNLITYLWF